MTAWDFGITPSEYLKHKEWRVSDAEEVSYDNRDNPLRHIVDAFGTAFLDDLFLMTLRVPRKAVDIDGALLEAVQQEHDRRSLVYIAQGVKPAGDADFSKPVTFPQGLHARAVSARGCYRYHVSRSEEIIGALADYENMMLGPCSHAFPQRIPYQDHRLFQGGYNVLHGIIRGLLYGYPVGDVLEFNTLEQNAEKTEQWYRENGIKPLDLLLHVPMAWQWSRHWAREVGIAGEILLQRAYAWALRQD